MADQYRPSNGTEGGCFIDAWCSICARDKVMNGEATDEDADRDQSLYCTILGSSFRDGGAPEWQYDKNGQPCCIAFVPKGERIPEPRCPHTMELPLDQQEQPTDLNPAVREAIERLSYVDQDTWDEVTSAVEAAKENGGNAGFDVLDCTLLLDLLWLYRHARLVLEDACGAKGGGDA